MDMENFTPNETRKTLKHIALLITAADIARALYPNTKGYPQTDTPFVKKIMKLYTQYHQALAALEAGSRTASMAGRELNRWQKDKSNLQQRLHKIAAKLQPSLFQVA